MNCAHFQLINKYIIYWQTWLQGHEFPILQIAPYSESYYKLNWNQSTWTRTDCLLCTGSIWAVILVLFEQSYWFYLSSHIGSIWAVILVLFDQSYWFYLSSHIGSIWAVILHWLNSYLLYTCRHVAPFGHIILTLSLPIVALPH